MGCGSCGPKKEKKTKATYVCVTCGREEISDAKGGKETISCCGEPMKKK